MTIKLIAVTLLLIFTLGSGGYKPYTATAYALKGRMANGQHVHSGAIAADPRVLPIGTKVTGGKIKGNRVDIWMPSRKAAIKFGRRTVQLKKL
jgi:3D (Asp-Asp-Asp) domain-containing protein